MVRDVTTDQADGSYIASVRSPRGIGYLRGRSVAGEAFVSPDVLDLELTRIFSTRWLPVALDHTVHRPGAYVATLLSGEPIVAVGQADGSVKVHVNACRHCAMPLVTGTGRIDQFECRRGGWVYGLDGSAEQVGGADSPFDPVEWGLVSAAQTTTRSGIVYASWDGADLPPPQVDSADDALVSSWVDVASNWKCAIESLVARPDAEEWVPFAGVLLRESHSLVAVTPIDTATTRVTVFATTSDAAEELARHQRWTVPTRPSSTGADAVVCANTGQACEAATGPEACPLGQATGMELEELPPRRVPQGSVTMYRAWSQAIGASHPEPEPQSVPKR